jgi:polyphosphate kinase
MWHWADRFSMAENIPKKVLPPEAYSKSGKLRREIYEDEINKFHVELVKLQEWVKREGLRVVILFEGRDAAGKGGVITRITEKTNPRVVKVVALGTPSDREKTQWYFQRYVSHLPAAGEIVLFDRSWYNRAGVERVMGFAQQEEVDEFLRSCPLFEDMLIRSGVIVLKYWFSISDEEQERRFQARLQDPAKFWKLSPMDIEARNHWEDYSKAKDEMFAHTDTKRSPWWVVNGEDKRRARLNCISHILSQIPYEDVTPKEVILPSRPERKTKTMRPPIDHQSFVPEIY